jgi:hypothetical protein
VVAVAGCGPGGLAVNEGVGDSHAVVGLRAQDDVLAADAGGLVWLRINMGRRGDGLRVEGRMRRG